MNITSRVVLKFGGSVLVDKSDLTKIRQEIGRFTDKGLQVMVVVSAYYGVTEQLIAKAHAKKFNIDSANYAASIAKGEFQSASDLVSELNRNNQKAILRTPKQLSFTAHGNRTAAKPESIDKASIEQALTQASIVVVPGFSAVDENGDCVLLGRGGSDISAVYLAQALNLNSVRLLKDVDGLYDIDPNKYQDARRLEFVTYQTATRIGGELIQTEAIEFAASNNICIDIAAIGQSFVSRIGPAQSQQDEKVPTPIAGTNLCGGNEIHNDSATLASC